METSIDLDNDYDGNCVICFTNTNEKNDKLQTTKTLEKLINYGKLAKQDYLINYLNVCIQNEKSVRIHRSCQKTVNNKLRNKNIPHTPKKNRKVETRQHTNTSFDWKLHCFFCEKNCVADKKHPDRDNRICRVETINERNSKNSIRETVLRICCERNDKDSERIQLLIWSCNDLVAAEARYHQNCYTRFVKNYSVQTKTGQPGRPVDVMKGRCFDRLCEWFESECEIYSLKELQIKLDEISETTDIYDVKTIKRKLIDRYGDDIYFGTVCGRSDVVAFKNRAAYLLNDFWLKERSLNTEEEETRIIKLAAKLILSSVRKHEFTNVFYPSDHKIHDINAAKEWLPSLLNVFMENIFKKPLHQVSVGHTFVNILRSRSAISPISFGLGIEMDHKFGSKWLTKELHALGFSISYDEITRFKQSVTENEDALDMLKQSKDGIFTQWMADNVDHNPKTLDGKGSLHGMGIIAATILTKGGGFADSQPVKRQDRKLVSTITKDKGVRIEEYIPGNKSGLSKIFFKSVLELKRPWTLPKDIHLDLVWHCLYFGAKKGRANWTGYMSNVSNGYFPGKSQINFLPILDMNPNNLSCIYSVLMFISRQAKFLNITTPIVTFDQPLWLGATEIVQSKELKIVLILGGFHMLMSFLGSMGAVMKCSGLEEALSTIYGTSTIEHIFSGKAISKAIRAHILVESALTTKLLRNILPVENDIIQDDDIPDGDFQSNDLNDKLIMEGDFERLTREEMEKLDNLYDLVEKEPQLSSTYASESKELLKVEENLAKVKSELSRCSRTASLWIQHLNYIQIVKLFIRAERTGNWNLHLISIEKMLNLFAATGHINYAKCARLHLQNMLELNEKFPWVYSCFANHGYHTVRRSERFWAGLWSDLIIEQCLMRSLKCSGGITRGRGVSDSVRQIWVSSMHRCAAIHEAMGQLTGQIQKTSEQHIELGKTRIKRDTHDLEKLIEWFDKHEPFDLMEENLKSLATGLTALKEDNINCDQTEEVGSSIQDGLNEICFESATIKRKSKILSLAKLTPSTKIGTKTIQIDPKLLFTRLLALLQREESIPDQFEYELTPEPTALYNQGLMRKSTKSVLRSWLLQKSSPLLLEDTTNCCVIDGGALLHRITWSASTGTFKDVLTRYEDYVIKRFSCHEKCYIIFDGYKDKLSLKSVEHQRRGQEYAPAISLSEDTQVTCSSKIFFKNQLNKESLIRMLSLKLRKCGFSCIQCDGDADVTIVQTAIDLSEKEKTTVYAEDTDILVLLLHHWQSSYKDIFYCTEIKEKSSRVRTLKLFSIKGISSAIDPEVLHTLLFIHAWGGCDSTCATYNQGKLKILKLVSTDQKFQAMAKNFGNISTTKSEVEKSACLFFIRMFQGKITESLSQLRYLKFMENIATSFKLNPATLPPSERAACHHGYTVHIQVSQWKQLDLSCLDPLDWGWKLDSNILTPIKTDLPPASDHLLEYVRCKCKLSSKNPCSTLVCSCKKFGLKCVLACGNCRGEDCQNNSIDISLSDDDDNDDIGIMDE